MFASRQFEEINPLIEVSKCAASPGAVTTATTVAVSAACTVGASGVGTAPATFVNGDQLEVFASPGAALNGVAVFAAPGATPGTCTLYFQNNTGGTVTPVAASVYTIIATRLPLPGSLS